MSLCSQKLTPVFPWEVDRVRPFLATLVDDLMDRAKVTYSEKAELVMIATGAGYWVPVLHAAKGYLLLMLLSTLQLSRTAFLVGKLVHRQRNRVA